MEARTNDDHGEEEDNENSRIARKEYAHILLHMGLETTIEKIYECGNMELIYYWVTNGLSNSTGKRKWNKFSSDRRMKEFVTFSDEAFAMLALENNAEKWRDSVKFPEMKKKDLPKARYTEGEEGNGWSEAGLMRFIELFRMVVKKRKDGGETRKTIENEVLKREKELRKGLSMQAKRKRWEDNESEEARMESLIKKRSLESCLLAMSNGEDIDCIDEMSGDPVPL